MRISTFLFGFVVLSLCLIEESDAVACTSLDPDVPTGCTDCTDPDNEAEDDCTTTTTTTTASPVTTVTTATVTKKKNQTRKKVRMNLNYAVVRRVKVRSNPTAGTSTRRRANNARVVGVIVG
ncbi:hypothetical protein KR222_009690 [Zaprionus bogoriensis]|nr:hypothetical protein KR222_009690 [Zaprionus bogoriensis]